MRTSTLMKRLNYLPVADAYCSEGGGRIFYRVRVPLVATNGANSEDTGEETLEEETHVIIHPKSGEELFRLVEDMRWRNVMEGISGSQGFENTHENVLTKDFVSSKEIVMDVEQREGLLWDFARNLISKGWVLDMKGYSTCFRVNRKKQISSNVSLTNNLNFDELPSLAPQGIGCSVNLGCIDFYPSASGKKNCCQYLVHKYLMNNHQEQNDKKHIDTVKLSPSNRWVCLCDDDNDIEMALYCHHAYIPCVSSESMQKAISNNQNHFSVTCDMKLNRNGVHATEHALLLILEEIKNSQ